MCAAHLGPVRALLQRDIGRRKEALCKYVLSPTDTDEMNDESTCLVDGRLKHPVRDRDLCRSSGFVCWGPHSTMGRAVSLVRGMK